MTELEKQLTTALERLSAQSARERQRDAEQIEALQLQAEQTAALQQQVEQQAGDNATLRRQLERLDGQVTRLAQNYEMLAATLRGFLT